LFAGIAEGDVGGFVTGGEDGLTKAEGGGVGPGVVGFSFELGVGGERSENGADGNVGWVGDMERKTGTGTDVSEQVPVASVELLREQNFGLTAQFHGHGGLAERGGGRDGDEKALRAGGEIFSKNGGGQGSGRQEAEERKTHRRL
jgi:hypothetical protein